MSSGWFWLPHFGDWMHDGQPSTQPQAPMASRVAVSHSRAARKPRSANPAPPGCPSYTKTVSCPVSGWSAVETPPMSQRSQVANSGSRPIEQCSAAWAAPGRSCSASPDSASTCSGTVHQTAQVRSERSGRSSGSSPITSPPGWRRLRNETTWWDTSTSPNESRQPAQSRCSRSATILMSVTSRADVE